MFRIFILPLTLLLFCFSSCKQKQNQQGHSNTVFDDESSVPADFMDFYMKFHQDSSYQVNHIQFPLDGLPSMALELPQDSINNFSWHAADWKIHKPFMGDENEYLKEFRVISKNLISEFIIEKQMGYTMERRFSKLGGNWYLIYYMDMNRTE